jgi:hypothetical protein
MEVMIGAERTERRSNTKAAARRTDSGVDGRNLMAMGPR